MSDSYVGGFRPLNTSRALGARANFARAQPIFRSRPSANSPPAEIVLNDVVRRFGSNVGTLRLGGVDVSDEDYSPVYRAMSRASEHSGHDQAAAKQIDVPTKKQMQADLIELTEFRGKKAKSNNVAAARRKAQTENPPKAATA